MIKILKSLLFLYLMLQHMHQIYKGMAKSLNESTPITIMNSFTMQHYQLSTK
jgi:hypothetical protein